MAPLEDPRMRSHDPALVQGRMLRAEGEPSSAGSAPIVGPDSVPVEPEEPGRAPLWLHRFSGIILILFCIELGILLVVLPWTTIWTENQLLRSYPEVQAFLARGWVRGVVSGLGVLDILIGVYEAVYYKWSGR